MINVPWLALGTIYLLFGRGIGNRVRAVLLVFTGFAFGVMLAAPIHGVIPVTGIPVGKDHFGVLPRALAGAASGIGAIVVFVGAAWSAVRFARSRKPGSGRLAGGNALIALGVLVLSSGGLLQGIVGSDNSFALSLAVGITVIYGGFVVASGTRRDAAGHEPVAPPDDASPDLASDDSSRRSNLPANERGSSSTSSTRVGSL